LEYEPSRTAGLLRSGILKMFLTGSNFMNEAAGPRLALTSTTSSSFRSTVGGSLRDQAWGASVFSMTISAGNSEEKDGGEFVRIGTGTTILAVVVLFPSGNSRLT